MADLILAQSRFFAGLCVDDLYAIHAIAKPMSLAQGTLLFERGDEGTAMYAIIEGEVELTFPGGLPSKTLEAGAVFGELALLSDYGRRTATATATTPVKLWVFDHEGVDALVETKPAIAFRLMRAAVNTLLSSEQQLIGDLQDTNSQLHRTLARLRATQVELDEKEEEALTDELTGLANLRAFNERIGTFAEGATTYRPPKGLALLYVDVDRLKSINDIHGHPSGDTAITAVANLVFAAVRPVTDLPCRIGGDELAVLIPRITREGADGRARAICESVRTTTIRGPRADVELPLSVSIGGTLLHPGEPLETFRARADRALYEAKQGGRDRVVWVA